MLELATLESPAVAKKVFWPEILDMGLPSSYSHCMGACLENDYHRRPHFDHVIHNFTKYGDRICRFSDKLFKNKVSTTDFVSALKHLESEGSEKIDVTPTPPSKHEFSDFDVLPASPGNSGYLVNESNFESPSKRDRFAKINDIRSYVSQKSYNGKSSFSSPSASQTGAGVQSMSKRSIGSATNSFRELPNEKTSSNGNMAKSASNRSLRGVAEVNGAVKGSGGDKGKGGADKKKAGSRGAVQKRAKKPKCVLL